MDRPDSDLTKCVESVRKVGRVLMSVLVCLFYAFAAVARSLHLGSHSSSRSGQASCWRFRQGPPRCMITCRDTGIRSMKFSRHSMRHVRVSLLCIRSLRGGWFGRVVRRSFAKQQTRS